MKRRFLSKEHRVSSAGENRTKHPCSLLPPLDPGRRRGRFLMLERVVMTLVTASRLMGGEMKNRNLWVPEESWERERKGHSSRYSSPSQTNARESFCQVVPKRE